MLRYDVGCDIIDAVEAALIDLWMHARLAPNTDNNYYGIPVDCAQCSSVLDRSNHKATKKLDLWMYRSEFQVPICTNHWQGQIQLCICDNPADQITGADAANFVKVLYKCYGVIVKDLRKKGFHLSLDRLVVEGRCNTKYDVAATITIGFIPALFDRGDFCQESGD